MIVPSTKVKAITSSTPNLCWNTTYLGNAFLNREVCWRRARVRCYELDQLSLQLSTSPETLRLSAGGSTYRWELGEVAHRGGDFLAAIGA